MIRAVLIEDDPRVARVNRDLLERAGSVRVIGVADGCAEGKRLVRALRPDLLLLDVFLPDGSGLDLLRDLRAEGQLADVILVTAADDLPSVRAALAHGALDYLIKPFDGARLRDALDRLGARRRLSGEALTQRQLDRSLGLSGHASLPKGIDAQTLERVDQLLRAAAQAVSAEEVGAGIGVSRVTAWRYLEYLLTTGRAELDFSYGAPGRPAKLYRAPAKP